MLVRKTMSWRRVAMVHVALTLLTSGSLYAIITNREWWPFSPYAMYSWVERDRSVTRLQLVGVTAGEVPREIPLVAWRHLQPFDDARLNNALYRLQMQPGAQQALSEALRSLLERYETLRRAGRHRGPPLQGIRLYHFMWLKINPRTFQVNHPDHVELLSEVMSSPMAAH